VNERAKAAEQRWAQVQGQFGDLSQVDPNVYRTAMSLASQLQANPVEVVTQLLTELSGHQDYGQAIISQAAKVLQGRRGSAPREDPEPQPDLIAENGAPVYSATQQREWLTWNQRRMQAEFEAKLDAGLRPLKELTQERAVARVQQQATETADRKLAEARQWHGFKDHEAEIAAAWKQHPEWTTLEQAYVHFFHDTLLPALTANAEAKVVAGLQQKAAANTLSPSSTSRSAAPDFKGDFTKALEFYGSKS
jgi:hypothetical protein